VDGANSNAGSTGGGGKQQQHKRVVDVVIVSDDRSEAGYEATRRGFDGWLAVPLKDCKKAKRKIRAHVPVAGYPSAGVVDARTGWVICEDIVAQVALTPKAMSGWLAECDE
jgi:hypothetical protein